MPESSVDKASFGKEAERRVLAAIDAREVADFSSLPAPERRLRAEFLQAILSGSGELRGRLCCPLRIHGAEIVGPLRPPSGVSRNSHTALQFRSCRFDSPVDLARRIVVDLNPDRRHVARQIERVGLERGRLQMAESGPPYRPRLRNRRLLRSRPPRSRPG